SVDIVIHSCPQPLTRAARRGLGAAVHSVASKRAIPAERRMLLAFGRERAPRAGVSERRIMPCQQAGDSCREKNAFFAFGRERAPRDGVSERRAIPSPVGGRFLLIEKCILAFGRERAPRGGVSER